MTSLEKKVHGKSNPVRLNYRNNSIRVSILIVEQNVYRALEVSDRAYVLEMGKVRFEGKSVELLQNTKIEDPYFGGNSAEF